MNTVFLGIVALLSALLFTGCGDGGRDKSADNHFQAALAPSKAEFVAHVNGICRRSWPKIVRNLDQYVSWQDPELAGKELYREAIRFSFMAGFDLYIFNEVHGLQPPIGAHHNGERFMARMKEAVEDALHHEWANSPSQMAAIFARYNRVARRYGTHECLVAGRHIPRLRLS